MGLLDPAIPLLHAFATSFMVGLIWFVQLVHYPLFQEVGASNFVRYEEQHQRRTTWIVAPMMLLELTTATWLTLFAENARERGLAIAGLGLLAVIWLSTAASQVPCHRRLEAGFDYVQMRRLVNSNWLRTIAWSIRGAVAFALLRMEAAQQ